MYLVGMWKAGWLLAPPDAAVHRVLLWNWQEQGGEEVEADAESAVAESAVVVDETPPPLPPPSSVIFSVMRCLGERAAEIY